MSGTKNMFLNLVPGRVLTVDESMGLWKGKGMHGWMFVYRKPTHVGRESHTTADCDTGDVFFVEPYEGKAKIKTADFVAHVGSNPAKALRCVKLQFGSGRCVILDSDFASYKCVVAMTEHGMFVIGNDKTALVGFPKS